MAAGGGPVSTAYCPTLVVRWPLAPTALVLRRAIGKPHRVDNGLSFLRLTADTLASTMKDEMLQGTQMPRIHGRGRANRGPVDDICQARDYDQRYDQVLICVPKDAEDWRGRGTMPTVNGPGMTGEERQD